MRRPSEVVQGIAGLLDDCGGRCLKVYQDFSDEDPVEESFTYFPRLLWSSSVAGLDVPLGFASDVLESFVSIPMYNLENKYLGVKGHNPGWRHNTQEVREDY